MADSKHPSPKRYPPELRERAVRLVAETSEQTGTRPGVVGRVARQLGIGTETLREWVKRAEVDGGRRPGVPTEQQRRLAELERENRALRRARTTPTHVLTDHHQPYRKAIQETIPSAAHVRTGPHRAKGETTKPIERPSNAATSPPETACARREDSSLCAPGSGSSGALKRCRPSEAAGSPWRGSCLALPPPGERRTKRDGRWPRRCRPWRPDCPGARRAASPRWSPRLPGRPLPRGSAGPVQRECQLAERPPPASRSTHQLRGLPHLLAPSPTCQYGGRLA
jgi:transposase